MKVTASVVGREVIRVAAGSRERSFGLAVDIGTTTLAGYLCELASGRVVATHSMMNPQVAYGEDVMARISYVTAHDNGLAVLHDAVMAGINGIAAEAAGKAGITPGDIVDVVLVGNTCMHHLLLNISPEYLGLSPFLPAVQGALNVKARDIGLAVAGGAYAYVLPVEAGFVGADNVGVLISEKPYHQELCQLIIDIGTNGELVLGNHERLLSCSCATGPAFEGAEIKFGMRAAAGAIEKVRIDAETKEVRFKVIGRDEWNTAADSIGARGICGSGILDAAAQLYLAGIIEHNGRFARDLPTTRLRGRGKGREFVIAWANETAIGQDITVTQQDIRNIQLAKGALSAGAQVLLNRMGQDKPDEIILAGAFGSYIDIGSAVVLGLFPDCAAAGGVRAVGNAAGSGACLALLDRASRKEAETVARKVEYVELTAVPEFHKLFVAALWLPPLTKK